LFSAVKKEEPHTFMPRTMKAMAEFLALFVTIGFLIAKRKKYYYA
jgi:hypothetical protein